MKIKNLAFFGIMASILSIGGAHALTPSETQNKSQVIASQAYVDAREKAAKDYADDKASEAQDYTNTQIQDLDATATDAANASATAITSISQEDGKIIAEQGQLTSAAISDSVTTAEGITSGATGLATAGAVYLAIDAVNQTVTDLDVAKTANGNEDAGVVKYVTQTDGEVSVEKAKITTEDIDANAAILGSQLATDTITDTQIAKDAVKSDEIADGAVEYAKIASAAKVTSTQIGDNQTLNNAVAVANQDLTFPTVGAVIEHVEKTTGAAINSLDFDEKTGVIMKISQLNGKIDATPGTIKDANVDDAAEIKYAKMDSALAEINGQTGFAPDTNCTGTNPCILSYAGPTEGYKWTQMVFPTTPTTPASN